MGLNIISRGSGPPLVLLHGWGFNAAVWDPLLPRLTPHFTTLAVDLPGYGLSAAPDKVPVSLENLSEAVIDQVPAGANWLGWSFGGLMALSAAMHRPERIRRLALISVTPCFIWSFTWPCGLAEAELKTLRAHLLRSPVSTLRHFAGLCAAGGDQIRRVTRQPRECLEHGPEPDPRTLLEGLDILAETDLRARLYELKCPSLWIFGAADRLVSCRTAEAIAGLLPSARTSIIPGAAHAPFLSHPDECTGRILDFLHERTQR